jgi:hypothetical protein
VEFADEGTEIWATECMLSNVNALPRVPERVKGVREHDCNVLGCSDECERPKYDFRVKWDGMRPQCSTWESCIQRIGLNLASKRVLDNYGTSVLVKDVDERFRYLENHDTLQEFIPRGEHGKYKTTNNYTPTCWALKTVVFTVGQVSTVLHQK